MVPELRFLFLFGPVVGSMTFKGHFFRPFFMLTLMRIEELNLPSLG